MDEKSSVRVGKTVLRCRYKLDQKIFKANVQSGLKDTEGANEVAKGSESKQSSNLPQSKGEGACQKVTEEAVKFVPPNKGSAPSSASQRKGNPPSSVPPSMDSVTSKFLPNKWYSRSSFPPRKGNFRTNSSQSKGKAPSTVPPRKGDGEKASSDDAAPAQIKETFSTNWADSVDDEIEWEQNVKSVEIPSVGKSRPGDNSISPDSTAVRKDRRPRREERKFYSAWERRTYRNESLPYEKNAYTGQNFRQQQKLNGSTENAGAVDRKGTYNQRRQGPIASRQVVAYPKQNDDQQKFRNFHSGSAKFDESQENRGRQFNSQTSMERQHTSRDGQNFRRGFGSDRQGQQNQCDVSSGYTNMGNRENNQTNSRGRGNRPSFETDSHNLKQNQRDASSEYRVMGNRENHKMNMRGLGNRGGLESAMHSHHREWSDNPRYTQYQRGNQRGYQSRQGQGSFDRRDHEESKRFESDERNGRSVHNQWHSRSKTSQQFQRRNLSFRNPSWFTYNSDDPTAKPSQRELAYMMEWLDVGAGRRVEAKQVAQTDTKVVAQDDDDDWDAPKTCVDSVTHSNTGELVVKTEQPETTQEVHESDSLDLSIQETPLITETRLEPVEKVSNSTVEINRSLTDTGFPSEVKSDIEVVTTPATPNSQIHSDIIDVDAECNNETSVAENKIEEPPAQDLIEKLEPTVAIPPTEDVTEKPQTESNIPMTPPLESKLEVTFAECENVVTQAENTIAINPSESEFVIASNENQGKMLSSEDEIVPANEVIIDSPKEVVLVPCNEVAIVPCKDVAIVPCKEVAIVPCKDVAIVPCKEVAIVPCKEVAIVQCKEVSIVPCKEVAIVQCKEVAIVPCKEVAIAASKEVVVAPSVPIPLDDKVSAISLQEFSTPSVDEVAVTPSKDEAIVTPSKDPCKKVVVAPCKEVIVAPCKDVVIAPCKEVVVAPCKDVVIAPCKEVVVAPCKDVVIAPCKEVVLIPSVPISLEDKVSAISLQEFSTPSVDEVAVTPSKDEALVMPSKDPCKKVVVAPCKEVVLIPSVPISLEDKVSAISLQEFSTASVDEVAVTPSKDEALVMASEDEAVVVVAPCKQVVLIPSVPIPLEDKISAISLQEFSTPSDNKVAASPLQGEVSITPSQEFITPSVDEVAVTPSKNEAEAIVMPSKDPCKDVVVAQCKEVVVAPSKDVVVAPCKEVVLIPSVPIPLEDKVSAISLQEFSTPSVDEVAVTPSKDEALVMACKDETVVVPSEDKAIVMPSKDEADVIPSEDEVVVMQCQDESETVTATDHKVSVSESGDPLLLQNSLIEQEKSSHPDVDKKPSCPTDFANSAEPGFLYLEETLQEVYEKE